MTGYVAGTVFLSYLFIVFDDDAPEEKYWINEIKEGEQRSHTVKTWHLYY